MHSASGSPAARKTGRQTLRFSRGLPGLEGCRGFLLEPLPDNELFFLLRAAGEESLALILVNPYPFFPDYRFELSAEERAGLKTDRRRAQVSVYTTVTIVGKQLFTNLAAPLVINLTARVGRQIILPDSIDKLRVPLLLR